MSVLSSIWLASLLAAILVFAAGLLWGRADVARVREAAELRLGEAERSLEEAKRRGELAARSLSESEARTSGLEARLASLEASKAEAEGRARTLEASLSEALARGETADRARSEAEKRAAAAERGQAEATREAERATQDVSLSSRDLETYEGRLERARAESGRLRAEVARLEATIREREASVPGPVSEKRPVLPAAGATLDAVVRALAARAGSRSTVIADDLGFPVVGIGDEQEPLAALCGVLHELRARAGTLLALGRVDRVTLETDEGLSVSACSREHDDFALTLATITPGPGLATRELRETLHHVFDALVRGEPRVSEELSS